MQLLRKDRLEPLNLSKLRYFLEQGRLDARYPILQRHLYDSRCARNVKNGVRRGSAARGSAARGTRNPP